MPPDFILAIQERSLIALLALLASLLLAAVLERARGFLPSRFVPPVLTMLLRFAERKLNRDKRSVSARRQRGNIICALVIAGNLGIGIAVVYLLAGSSGRVVAECVALLWLLPLGSAFAQLMHVHQALEDERLEAARMSLGGVWRNRALLDAHGCARAGMETLAVQFSEHTAARIMIYLLFGLPGLLAHAALKTMAELFGAHREGFGHGAYVLDFLLNYIPGRIGVMLLALATFFLPFTQARTACLTLLALPVRASATVAALGTMAGSLQLALGGPLSAYMPGGWIGSGRAQVGIRDMRRALGLITVATVLLLLLLAYFTTAL